LRRWPAVTRHKLGEDRLAWLRGLPRIQTRDFLSLVHASPANAWRAPTADAPDAELESVYGPLGAQIVAYGHIHHGYIRKLSLMTVINTGSVSLSYDTDPRASYLLLDDGEPTIRRVVYDLRREISALLSCGLPHADWIARTLQAASPQMP
jgi:hypothetical protein